MSSKSTHSHLLSLARQTTDHIWLYKVLTSALEQTNFIKLAAAFLLNVYTSNKVFQAENNWSATVILKNFDRTDGQTLTACLSNMKKHNGRRHPQPLLYSNNVPKLIWIWYKWRPYQTNLQHELLLGTFFRLNSARVAISKLSKWFFYLISSNNSLKMAVFCRRKALYWLKKNVALQNTLPLNPTPNWTWCSTDANINKLMSALRN